MAYDALQSLAIGPKLATPGAGLKPPLKVRVPPRVKFGSGAPPKPAQPVPPRPAAIPKTAQPPAAKKASVPKPTPAAPRRAPRPPHPARDVIRNH